MSATETSRTTWQPGMLDRRIAGRRGVRGMSVVLRGYWRPFAGSVALGAANQGLQVAAAALGAYVVASALTGADVGELRPLVWGLAVMVLLRAAAVWGEAWVSHELAFRVLAEVRMWLYDAFVRLAPGKLTERRSGDLVAAAMSDSEAMEMFYAHSLIYAVVAAIVPTASLAGVLVIDAQLALVLIPALLAATVVPLLLRRANARQGRRVRTAVARTNSDVVDAVQGIAEVLSFGQGEALQSRIDQRTRELARLQAAQGVRAGAEVGSATLVTSLGTLAVLVVGAYRVADGALDIRMLPVAVVLAGFTFQPLLTLLNATRVWGVTTAAADRVFDLLEEPPAVADLGSAPLPERTDVAFTDVAFTYPGGESPALDGVSFRIDPGETVALVGHSGAGKSTCAHLLLRFFDPDQGTVSIGGTALPDLPLDLLYRTVAFVPQDVFLLNDTIAANLRLGRPDATDEQFRAAAEAAQALGFIETFEDGFDTLVGERGTRLSGGERQRIAIARALLRDAPVLVLDEGTSMLDAESERGLQVALDRARSERTTLVIAHRLSTILSADRVVVLERGRVAGSGRHDELLETSPAYARLVDRQWAGLTDLIEQRNKERT